MRLRELAMGALGLALGACAAGPSPTTGPAPPPGGAPLAAVVTPPSPTETLLAAHRERAAGLEQTGRYRQALDEWKVALTVAPRDAAALEGRKRMEDRIEQGVTRSIGLGRAALAKGDQLEARRHFLSALALDPANATAFNALQNEVKELRFVSYTVKRGDTLATIAERYYGDRARSEVIWETNQLPPNPRLAVGAVLKIPEIPGVPFVNPENRPRPPAEATVRPDAPGSDPSRPEGLREETTEINPLLVEAKEALDKSEFQVALADVDKVLGGNAQNPDGLDLKKQILYGLGKAQLGQRRYDESLQTLGQLAKLAPNYQDSPALARRAKEQAVQQHYRQGLELYQQEKLDEAIAQWKLVLEYDPQHLNAKRNLDRAEAQLKLLQQRQQPKKPTP